MTSMYKNRFSVQKPYTFLRLYRIPEICGINIFNLPDDNDNLLCDSSYYLPEYEAHPILLI